MTADLDSQSDALPPSPGNYLQGNDSLGNDSLGNDSPGEHPGLRSSLRAQLQHPQLHPAQVPPRRATLRGLRAPAHSPPLERVGRYAVLGQIAGGGMGSVFLALLRGPASFTRLVAIKCLHTRWLEDPKYVARFATEIRLSTRIRHPNVVQTLDVVEDAGELFLVMEYVDGVTLAALLADLTRLGRPLPVELAAGILAKVLRGLHAAHETTDEAGAPLHIVHRDVSPQNIMISRAGHVHVLDFGAAKAVEHTQHTAAGVLVGKLAYMAPEQVHGERSSVRTDVFAAGVVLWEALVGKRLFYEPGLARAELLQALVRKPVEPPSQLRSGVPPALDECVRKALERSPRRRYQSALEFALALEAAGACSSPEVLGRLVTEVCSTRLADKDALVRSGLAAAELEASTSTPRPAHGLVPAPRLAPFGGLVVSSPAPAAGRARVAWAAAVLTAVAGALGAWRALGPAADAGRRASPGAERDEHVQSIRHALGAAPGLGEPAPPPKLPPSPPPAVAAAAASRLAEGAAVSELAPGELEPVAQVSSRAPAPRGVPARRPRRASPAAPEGKAARPRATRERERAPRAARSDCEPPTYMDAAGIRHFKRGCL